MPSQPSQPTTPHIKPTSYTTFSSLHQISIIFQALPTMQLMHYLALMWLPCHWLYPLTYPHWPKLNGMRMPPQLLRVPPLCYNLLPVPPQTSPVSVTWLRGLLALMHLKNYDISSSHNSMVFRILEFVPHNNPQSMVTLHLHGQLVLAELFAFLTRLIYRCLVLKQNTGGRGRGEYCGEILFCL